MNTKAPLFLILSLGVAVAMVQGSGVVDLWGTAGPTDDLSSGDKLQEKADSHNLEGAEDEDAYEGQVNDNTDSDFVGLVLGTVPKMLGLLVIPGMMGGELMALGIYSWAAIPLGLLTNLILYIMGFQIATGREVL